MSGEGSGVILGTALALPVIAVAGVGLVAYGAAKAIFAIGKSACEMYKAHEKQVQLQLTSTNQSIDNFYASLDSILASQNQNITKEIEKAQVAITAAARNLENIQADPEHFEQWQAEVTAASKKIYEQLHQSIKNAADTNRVKAQQQIKAAEDILAKQMKVQFDLDNKLAADKAKKAELHNRVKLLLNQSLAALDQLAARDIHNLIQGNLAALRDAYDDALKAHNMGADETVLASAQTLLRESAALASTLAQREEARWEALFGAHLALSNVRNRLSESRSLDFTNPHDHKEMTLDLNDFVGGRLEEMQDLVENKLNQLELAMGIKAPKRGEPVPVISNAEADLLQQQVELTVVPEMESLQEEAIEQLSAYLDRLHCLDVISKELEECSSYQLQWTMPEGADPTAPINMQLYNTVTHDKVTITVGTNTANGTMSLDTHTYNAYGQVTDENYRDAFYKMVVNSLQKADPGVVASLNCCQDTRNKNSADTNYMTPDSVEAIPTPQIPLLASDEILN